jgi:hypothetical protein
MSRKASAETRQSRREYVGTRGYRCCKCWQHLARHRVNGDRLCCECYVKAGHAPADWHPDCMAAAAALRDAIGAGHT